MALTAAALDRAADVLRRQHAAAHGIPASALLPWRSLKDSEQQQWRQRAASTRPVT